MARRILITGGAGFIGSHVADALLAAGHRVRVLDTLIEQVHGPLRERPSYLADDVELIVGDVRDPDVVRSAVAEADAVFHFAALVGVGQSMYDIARYTHVNNVGTATLLEVLTEHPIERLVVASSMSVYGEGAYRDVHGTTIDDAERTPEQLRDGRWEPCDPHGEPLVPIPTCEHKPPTLSSVYALSKFDQERLCLVVGRAYGIPTIALRFFNVYGTRQALSNPYTGVLAIFASRLLNRRPPLLFEDGMQQRDFVHVRDVARACCLALEAPPTWNVCNVGSGRAMTVREVAERMATQLGVPEIAPQVTGRYRTGDIRHCVADITRARADLGYDPSVRFEDGLVELADWLAGQQATDKVDQALAELSTRGLTV